MSSSRSAPSTWCWRRPALLVLLALLAQALGAQDVSPAPPAALPPASAARWIDALPAVPELVHSHGKVEWRAGADALPITGVDDAHAEAIVQTAIGSMHLPVHLIADRHLELLHALPALLAQARQAHLVTSAFTLQVGVITGPALHAQGVTVLPDAVLRDEPVAPPDRVQDLQRLASSQAALLALLPATGLDGLCQQALADVIRKVAARQPPAHAGDLDPRLARLLVRHGYLRPYCTSPEGQRAVAAVEAALSAAVLPRPTRIARAPDRRMEEMCDAFGAQLWQMRSPHGTTYAYREPSPSWMPAPPLYVVIDLPPVPAGAARDVEPDAARICDGQGNCLASWSRAGGFTPDTDRWWQVLPRRGGPIEPNALPPHLLLCRPDGDVIGLVAGHGLLHALRESSHEAVDAFLAEAATQLTTPANLDLLGEYLFSYTYPSPEASHPQLVGTSDLKSNVHRTVWQSCGAATGGVIHGHCADIAEIYEDITRRQGRNPIVIGLPGHAACAWAQRQDDGWEVHLLQTGPPLVFQDERLQEALHAMYAAFDPAVPFTPDAVPLLLRFSDDIARSQYTLSWRIFAEPDYCRTLVAVQRDLHEHTYLHGFTTMQRLIAAGDTDPANYAELCGLATHCGKYDLAVAYCARARARTSASSGRLLISGRMLHLMLEAGERDQAEQMAEEVIKEEVPDAREAMGAGFLVAELQFAQACVPEDAPCLQGTILELLGDDLNEPMAGLMETMRDALRNQDANGLAVVHDPQVQAAVELVGAYVRVGRRLLQVLSPEERRQPAAVALAANIQTFYDEIAFDLIDERAQVMDWYGALGSWLVQQGSLDAFLPRLDAVAPATDAQHDHQQRSRSAAQQGSDLRWIRASVPFWYTCLLDQFGHDQAHLDAVRVTHLAQRLDEAVAATQGLGLATPSMRLEQLIAHELSALAGRDAVALRTALRAVAASGDKAARDLAATMLGLSARLLDPSWFASAIAVWQQTMDDKSNCFHIAWLAAIGHAPQQALAVATMAVARYPDEVTFAQECGYMREVLTAPQGTGPVPTPSPARAAAPAGTASP